MAVSPFDIVKHLNEKTPLDFDINDYDPYMVNRAMSNTLGTLFYAEAMSMHSNLSKEAQYLFYLHAVPKERRFGKWHKSPPINKYVDMICLKYQVSRRVAESYLKLMDETSLEELEQQMNEGGRSDGSRKFRNQD